MLTNTKEQWSQGKERFKEMLDIKQKDKNLAMELNKEMWKWEYIYKWNLADKM